MKKAISTIITLLIATCAFAQLTNVKDTVFASIPVNGSMTITDTLFNFGTTDISLTWNVDPNSYVAPGHTGISVCFFPGACYLYDYTVRTSIIPPSSAAIMMLTWEIDATAAVGSTSYVILNTDIGGGKDLVRKITATGTVSVEDADLPSIKFFPQPAADVLHVEMPQVEASKIEIVNLGGAVINSTPTFGSSNVEISLRDVSAGLYILNIYDAENKVITRRKITKN
jgi:Secretion system C-terminal sorting domain